MFFDYVGLFFCYGLSSVFQNLTRLYMDKATLVWNGTAVSGQDALSEFFESLPSSEFQVQTLDCQPVHGQWGNMKPIQCSYKDNFVIYSIKISNVLGKSKFGKNGIPLVKLSFASFLMLFIPRTCDPRPDYFAGGDWWVSQVWRQQTAVLQPEFSSYGSGFTQRPARVEDRKWLFPISGLEQLRLCLLLLLFHVSLLDLLTVFLKHLYFCILSNKINLYHQCVIYFCTIL